MNFKSKFVFLFLFFYTISFVMAGDFTILSNNSEYFFKTDNYFDRTYLTPEEGTVSVNSETEGMRTIRRELSEECRAFKDTIVARLNRGNIRFSIPNDWDCTMNCTYIESHRPTLLSRALSFGSFPTMYEYRVRAYLRVFFAN